MSLFGIYPQSYLKGEKQEMIAEFWALKSLKSKGGLSTCPFPGPGLGSSTPQAFHP